MSTYNVIWEIDVEADDPKEAAQRARDIQRDPESRAGVFKVRQIESPTHEIDLDAHCPRCGAENYMGQIGCCETCQMWEAERS